MPAAVPLLDCAALHWASVAGTGQKHMPSLMVIQVTSVQVTDVLLSILLLVLSWSRDTVPEFRKPRRRRAHGLVPSTFDQSSTVLNCEKRLRIEKASPSKL